MHKTIHELKFQAVFAGKLPCFNKQQVLFGAQSKGLKTWRRVDQNTIKIILRSN